MLRILEILLLAVTGLVLIATGATGLVDPQALFTPLDLQLESTSAHNEMRATYGGLHVAMGLFLVAGALRAGLRRPALWVALAFTGGLTVGRAVSFIVDGSPNEFVYGLWIPEGLAAIVAAALLASGRNTPWHESGRTS
ncbi:MAG: DUF4345 domain-containing protein [Deltaproteobacteria bacterium]|nr:DUF4345 domain-containing protein [Deltaproteobacteria bacterium]